MLEDPVIRNVIILQTVLQEVRHRSAPVYKRLKDIVHEKEKHFYTFTNEHHRYKAVYGITVYIGQLQIKLQLTFPFTQYSFVIYLWLLHIFSERHSLNENQVRARMTGTTAQSAWHQNGTASTWRRPRLALMASRWSSSLMTKGTSRKQKTTACWCTNVSCLSSEKEIIVGHCSSVLEISKKSSLYQEHNHHPFFCKSLHCKQHQLHVSLTGIYSLTF